MGEPLAQRTAKEIAWAEQLADRLSRSMPPPDLSAERAELASLEEATRRQQQHGRPSLPAPPAQRAGRGAELDLVSRGQTGRRCPGRSPLLPLPFRIARRSPQAKLHIAADDACEVLRKRRPRGAPTIPGGRRPSSPWQSCSSRAERARRAGGEPAGAVEESGRLDRPPGGDARHRGPR